MSGQRPGEDPGRVELVDVMHIAPERRWVLDTHVHDCHELVLVLRGTMRSRVGDQDLVAHAAEALVYRQGVAHAPASEGPPPEMLVMHWRGGEAAAQLVEAEVRVDMNQRLRHQLHWLLDLQPSLDAADRRLIDAISLTVVHELGQLRHPDRRGLVDRTRRFIRRNLHRRITLDDLAADAMLSRYHFARKFRQLSGQTPMGMVSRMRIDAARPLILRTNLTLDAIAVQVGLAGGAHLSHLYRRLEGHPPGALRRSR